MKIGICNLKSALRFVAYTSVFISLCHQPTLDKLNPQFENAKHLFKIIMPELVSTETYLALCTHCKPMVRYYRCTVDQNALRNGNPFQKTRTVHVLAH